MPPSMTSLVRLWKRSGSSRRRPPLDESQVHPDVRQWRLPCALDASASAVQHMSSAALGCRDGAPDCEGEVLDLVSRSGPATCSWGTHRVHGHLRRHQPKAEVNRCAEGVGEGSDWTLERAARAGRQVGGTDWCGPLGLMSPRFLGGQERVPTGTRRRSGVWCLPRGPRCRLPATSRGRS